MNQDVVLVFEIISSLEFIDVILLKVMMLKNSTHRSHSHNTPLARLSPPGHPLPSSDLTNESWILGTTIGGLSLRHQGLYVIVKRPRHG
jgi:hypothetical protein